MYLRYGNYLHANNEVGFTITREAKRSQGGTFYAYQREVGLLWRFVELHHAGGHQQVAADIAREWHAAMTTHLVPAIHETMRRTAAQITNGSSLA